MGNWVGGPPRGLHGDHRTLRRGTLVDYSWEVIGLYRKRPALLGSCWGSVGRALSIQRLERSRSHSRLYGISIVDRAWAGGGRRASGSVCEWEASVIGYTLPIAQSFGQVPMSKVAAPQDRDAQGAWACRGTKQVRRVSRGLHRATTSGGARESAAAVNRSMTTMAPPH